MNPSVSTCLYLWLRRTCPRDVRRDRYHLLTIPRRRQRSPSPPPAYTSRRLRPRRPLPPPPVVVPPWYMRLQIDTFGDFQNAVLSVFYYFIIIYLVIILARLAFQLAKAF